MLPALTLLLVYQTVGEIISHALDLPVPGPVIGMLLLFVSLLIKGEAPQDLRETATTLLSHLSLLFVPAGVGVMVHFGRIRAETWPIVISLVASTALTIAVSALIFSLLRKPR